MISNKIPFFQIRRPYFHVKPLEEVQLINWADYLSFEEAEAAESESTVREELKAQNPELSETELTAKVLASDVVLLARRRVKVLYERCLVACALYEHFWIRYARYTEVCIFDRHNFVSLDIMFLYSFANGMLVSVSK